MPTKESNLRRQFLDYVFGEREGYVCIGTGPPANNGKEDTFEQELFKGPWQRDDIGRFVEKALFWTKARLK